MASPFPSVIVEAAFTTDPASTPSWTAISGYARSFGCRRGRQFELDRVQAGTAEVRLSNQDRRFDPNFTSSPYYPNVVPRRRLRIRATWASVTYPVFAGYVEKWPQTWGLSGTLSETNVPVSDGFTLFGQAALNTSYAAELSSVRVNNVLDTLGWGSGQAGIIGDATYGLVGSTAIVGPVGDRDVRTGYANLQASVLENTTALEHLMAVAASENGNLFMSRAGDLTFLARDYSSGAIYGTFGDATGELPYQDLTLDTAPIYNEVRLTATGGVEQVSSDAASKLRYFFASKVQGSYLQASDADLASLASWWVYKFKDPRQRVTSLVVNPARSPTLLWPQVLAREIGDHILVRRRPPGGGSAIEQEAVIEGIEHSVMPGYWTTRFSLSPAEAAPFMVVDSGVIGTGVVAY